MTGEELKKIRLKLLLTTSMLAKKLGVDVSTVTRWESGKRKISPSMAKLIRFTKKSKKS